MIKILSHCVWFLHLSNSKVHDRLAVKLAMASQLVGSVHNIFEVDVVVRGKTSRGHSKKSISIKNFIL